MSWRRAGLLAGAISAAALVILPTVAVGQNDCVGDKPRGGRYVASAELYLKYARTNPRPDEKAKYYRQAVDVLREGFENQPDNPRNYELAGQALVGLGQYAAADSAYTTAENMWSCYGGLIDTLRYNAWVPAFNRGVGAAQQGDIETAMQFYENAWTIYDKLPQPMLQIGTVYAQQAVTAETDAERDELQEKAIETYRLALDVLAADPHRLREDQKQEYGRAASFNLAQLLAFEERFEEAAEAYEDFLEQEPGNVNAMSNAAVVLTRASVQLSSQAEEMEEGPEKELLLAKADSLAESANAYYRDLLARDDLEADEYHNVGLGLLQVDLNEEATHAFRKAIALEHYRVNSLEQLARALFAAERYDTLAVVAGMLSARYPLNLDNLALLANAYRETEEVDSALAVLQRREALPCEIADLDFKAEEGTYAVSGYLLNLKMAPDTPVELQFDFYDNTGEVVATETIVVAAPAEQEDVEFEVTTQSTAAITGFTYKPLNLGVASTGT